MATESYAQIGVVLPVCLHLDGRTFVVQVEDKRVELTTHNIASEEPTWVDTATNMEVRSDEFSHFRFTVVTAKIPQDVDCAVKDVLKKHETIFFEALNGFVASCRIALGRFGLRSYHDYGQFVRPVQATIVGPANPEGEMMAAFTFGGGPLVGFRPTRSGEDHEAIQRILDTGIPIPAAFLADAKGYLHRYDPVHSLLSAVIALDVSVSNAIRRLATTKGIPAGDISRFIIDVGLSGNIKTTLRLVTEAALPEDTVFASCKGAITTRNAVMHEGRRSVVAAQVATWLPDIEKMIAFCESLGN